ncbi:polysaccharide pyruvyl transferase family protein, partial [Gammaproteobacteria bacterium]|nr:polysaccharide pyruvyl transferase family protein [Gammaproteobacteria bacterium]
GERLDVLAYTDEFDFIHEATKARACISMSFHGAILSMIGGCPSIPVTMGDYYDYKYIGFSSYNPSEPIPLISLAEEASEVIIASSIAYFVRFQPDSVWLERERSNESINNAYSYIANIVRSN